MINDMVADDLVMQGARESAAITLAWCSQNRTSSTPEPHLKTIYPGIGISILKVRRPCDKPFFIMGIPVLVSHHFYIETASCRVNSGHV